MKRYMAIIFIFILFFSIFNVDVYGKSKFSGTWKSVVREKSKELKAGEADKLKLKYELAVAYSNLGQIERATKLFKELKKIKGWKDKLEEMIPVYYNKFKATPNNIKEINYLAFAYYIDSKHNKAEKIFKKVLRLDSNNIWTYNYLAVIQHKLKKYKKAHQNLKKSLEIEDNQYTHFLLGANYYKMGKVFKAVYHVGKGRKAADLFLD